MFLNACEAGQMDLGGSENDSLIHFFVLKGAIGVLGPQVKIPIGFATKFAVRFMELITNHLDPSESNLAMDVATAVKESAGQLLVENLNPLGVVYAVYNGGMLQVQS